MGLGLLIFLLLCLLAAGAWGIAAVSQAKTRHRQEMMNLVRGRNTGQNVNKAGLTNVPESLLSPPVPPRQVQVQMPVQTLSNADLHRAQLVYEQKMMDDTGRSRQHNQPARKELVVPLHIQRAIPKPADSSFYSRWAKQTYEKAAAKAAQDQLRVKSSRSRQPGPCTLNISYVDADGAWSHRNVAPYKSGATNIRFDAWCDTRKGRRTFYFERIQCGTDLRTGCQLSQASVFQIIHPGRSVPPRLE